MSMLKLTCLFAILSLTGAELPPPGKYSFDLPVTGKPNYGLPKASYGLGSTTYGPAQPASYGAPPPSTNYGPPPPSSNYGPPAAQPASGYLDSAYDTLRDFSNSADSAFVRRRLFNTSVALTVPLFSFTLPQRASQGSTVDLANQAIFGLFSLLVVVLIFAVPILFTGSRPGYTAAGSGLTGRSSSDSTLAHLMSNKHVFNLMGADLTNNIGLDTDLCLKKTICEVQRWPKRWGVLGAPVRMLFPPPTTNTTSTSSYQQAATNGKGKKDCKKLYNCFFDLLDLGEYFIDWWKYSSSGGGEEGEYVRVE